MLETEPPLGLSLLFDAERENPMDLHFSHLQSLENFTYILLTYSSLSAIRSATAVE